MRARSTFRACLLVTGILLPSLAFAIDGERLITPDAALRGGVTPGDGPGYPVTISQPGSYKLTDNLNVSPGLDGISVTVSDVTINLNGWRLFGDSKARHGVSAVTTANRVSVRNGLILNFVNSAITGRESEWVVDEVDVQNGGPGIRGGNGLTVSRSTVSGATIGIVCEDACRVAESDVDRNGAQGIVMRSGIVMNSNLRENGSYAISSSDTRANRIGFGHNIMIKNNRSGPQVLHPVVAALASNYCVPEC